MTKNEIKNDNKNETKNDNKNEIKKNEYKKDAERVTKNNQLKDVSDISKIIPKASSENLWILSFSIVGGVLIAQYVL